MAADRPPDGQLTAKRAKSFRNKRFIITEHPSGTRPTPEGVASIGMAGGGGAVVDVSRRSEREHFAA